MDVTPVPLSGGGRPQRRPRSAPLREQPTPLAPQPRPGRLLRLSDSLCAGCSLHPSHRRRGRRTTGLIPSLFAACQGIKGERGYAGSPGEKGESVSAGGQLPPRGREEGLQMAGPCPPPGELPSRP